MNLRNKKGEMYDTIIFVLLNLIFFGVLITFVFQSASGKLVYEQAYVKQIALLIDEARPDTAIFIDFGNMVKIAEKNGIAKESIVKVDNKKSEVSVRLGASAGYSYSFFTLADIESEIKSDGGKYLLVLKIQKIK